MAAALPPTMELPPAPRPQRATTSCTAAQMTALFQKTRKELDGLEKSNGTLALVVPLEDYRSRLPQGSKVTGVRVTCEPSDDAAGRMRPAPVEVVKQDKMLKQDKIPITISGLDRGSYCFRTWLKISNSGTYGWKCQSEKLTRRTARASSDDATNGRPSKIAKTKNSAAAAPGVPQEAQAPPPPPSPEDESSINTLEGRARRDLDNRGHGLFVGARERQQQKLQQEDEELSAAKRRIDAEAAALEEQKETLQKSSDEKRATLAQKKNLQEATLELYSEYKKGHGRLNSRFETRDVSTGAEVLDLHAAHEQQMREEVGKLEADLNKLVQDLKTVNRNIEKKATEALKLADDHSVVTRNLEVLALRAPPEPLDGIYFDVISNQWEFNSKLEDLFDLKQPASYIYAGTSARVDLLEGRYKTHSGKVGGVMRVILVTGHEEADKAEKAAIKQLRTYASSKRKSAEVKNGSKGGEGIVQSPYHFVYVFYTPKILAA